jgi:hypothetical protein
MADDIPAATKVSPVANNENSRPAPRYRPDARECALLLLRLIQAKESESGRPLSRFRVAEISLRRIWGRSRITPEFVEDVSEWLLRAGRVLFFAGGSYGVILVSAVESWSRLSSKRIAPEIEQVLAGAYDFSGLEELLNAASGGNEDDA